MVLIWGVFLLEELQVAVAQLEQVIQAAGWWWICVTVRWKAQKSVFV